MITEVFHFRAEKLAFIILSFLLTGCNSNPFSLLIESKTAGFNGSFETTQNGLPVNWYIYKTTFDNGNAELVIDTINPYDGKQSLKFVITKCLSVGGWHSPGIFTEVDCENGSTYQVSFWIKNLGCKYTIKMDCWKGGTEDVNHPEKLITDNDTIPEWKKFEYEFTFDNDLNRFRFEMNILTPGVLWIDDVRIEKK